MVQTGISKASLLNYFQERIKAYPGAFGHSESQVLFDIITSILSY